MAFDIFISYRRNGGEDIARQVQLALENYGYTVFLDFDACDDGVFENKIKQGIYDSPIFLIVLSKGALNRCSDENDWVRREIEYAIELNKKFIPINPNKEFQDFPTECPRHIKEALGKNQFSEIARGQLFKASIEMLVNKRINSIIPAPLYAQQAKPKINTKKLLYIFVPIIALMISIGSYQAYSSHKSEQAFNEDFALYTTQMEEYERLSKENGSLPQARRNLEIASTIEDKYKGTEYENRLILNAGEKLTDVNTELNTIFNKGKKSIENMYRTFQNDPNNAQSLKKYIIVYIDSMLTIKQDTELLNIKKKLQAA